MKSKTIGFIVILLLTYCITNAQLQLISTTGDRLIGQNMVLNFSMGEVAVGTVSSNQQKLTQGFYQPAHISTSIENFEASQIQFFPNPIHKTLFIRLNQDLQVHHEFEVTIFDLFGKIIKYQTLPVMSGNEHLLDLGDQPSGIYLMHLQSKDKAIITTHKIIKQ